jgi:hypothetical protein
LRFEELGSSISDYQFILHILNNMTDDYDLQLAMMEKRVEEKCYDEKQNEESDNDNDQEVTFFSGRIKEKCRNSGVIDKAKDCKAKFKENDGQNGGNHNNLKIRLMALTAFIVVKQNIL